MELTSSTCEFVVVGSGIGGLAAARTLLKEGKNVRCVEARKRPGGRIKTTQQGFDLGAQSIHERAFLPELAKYGLSAVPYDEYQGTYIFGPEDTAPRKELPGADSIASLIKELRTTVANISIRLSMSVDELIEGGMLARINASLAKRIAWNRELFINALRAECGMELHELSIGSLLEANSYDGEDYSIEGGISAFPRAVARDLPIQYNTPVTGVEWSPRGVRLFTPSGEFHAKRAILNIPIGVLQDGGVQFSPALPPDIASAIDAVGNAVVYKIATRCREAFWPEDMTMLRTHFPDAPVFYTSDAGKPPTLTSLVGGREARRQLQKELHEIIELHRNRICTIFGESVRGLLGLSRMKPWNKDPWSKTAFTVTPTGKESVRDRLMQPIGDGVLRLAGEACIRRRSAGTIVGAYWSGVEQAYRAMAM